MTAQNKIATVFGGTGFVGRYVVQRLVKAGYTVKIATRIPERAYFLKPYGAVGQVVPFACDYATDESVAAAVAGADCVVNCIGILHERKKGDFSRAHVDLPRRIAVACAAQGVRRLVHISALGIDRAGSRYAETKREGEQAVRGARPDAVILRPAVIFGPEDRFFNLFAELARYLPCMPLIGGGRTKFQPVYVGDVADAVLASVMRPGAAGMTYELGGPEIVNFREIYARLFETTGRRRCLISMPWGMAKVQATFMALLPGDPLLTRDQVESLKADSVVTGGMPGLPELGIVPTAMGAILPLYLEYRCPGGRLGDKKRA